ncbi:MAG TPA: glycerophosphodiester phosphodiesterase family protein [Allocoleopsis sp.]
MEIIAHRGYSGITPENTITAFRTALQYLADSVEFDVQLTADQVPIIIHDYTLERTTNGFGLVREKTLSELKLLDNGSWFNKEFAGEKIPTLEEGLEVLQDIPKHIYIEVKNAHLWEDKDRDNLINIMEKIQVFNKCYIISFDHEFIDKIRAMNKEIKIGYLVARAEEYEHRLLRAIAAQNAIIMTRYNLLLDNPKLLEKTRQENIDIVAWTVDEKEDKQQLIKLGIDRITTNKLDL